MGKEKPPDFPDNVINLEDYKKRRARNNDEPTDNGSLKRSQVISDEEVENFLGFLPDSKVADLGKFRNKRETEQKFDLRREMQKIGIDKYRELENFVKGLDKKSFERVILNFYAHSVKNRSEQQLVEIFRDSNKEDWQKQPEKFKIVFEELKRLIKKYS